MEKPDTPATTSRPLPAAGPQTGRGLLTEARRWIQDQSVADLPSFRELKQQIRGGKILTLVVGRNHRAKLIEIEKQIDRLTRVVDNFYELLGSRHWIFHDLLPVEKVASMLERSPEDAERDFINLHLSEEHLGWWIRRLRRHAGMQPRMHLIEKAHADYQAGRYYSTAFLLIAVMDGFVNDSDKAVRRGMHAREADEMVAWDSLVGHHRGLSSVMPVFRKQFKATSTDEVFEVYRNGILHGNLTNFDNVVVATKAWNYLFAISDWATSLEKRQAPPPERPTWSGIFGGLKANANQKQALEAWRPSQLKPSDPDWETNSLVNAVRDFLSAWQRRNYGAVAQTLQAKMTSRSSDPLPKKMNEAFRSFDLKSYAVTRVDFQTPAIGIVSAEIVVNDVVWRSRSRWLFENGEGEVRVYGHQAGRWGRVFNSPEAFMNNDDAP